MPRLAQRVAPAPTLVTQLRRLHRQLLASERNALRRANDIGQVLRGIPPDQRGHVLREAGIMLRAGQLYARIADHWDEVWVACRSIRGADKFLRRPKPRVGPFLWPDWLDAFEASKLPPIASYTDHLGRMRSAVELDFHPSKRSANGV